MSTFTLSLLPDWNAVKAAWEPTLAHLTETGIDEETAHLLAMVSQELLENAVKYGAPRAGAQVALTLEVTKEAVTIEVKSPAGEEKQVEKLDETIQWIRGFQDPFEAYVEKLKQVSASPYHPGESGLGLARVAYEGGCVLDFYIDEDELLCISALWRPPHPLEAAAS